MASRLENVQFLKDAGLQEYVSRVPLWALGAIVVLNAMWLLEQFNPYMDLQKKAIEYESQPSPVAAELLRRPEPINYFWLQPHITSEPRKELACFAAIAALALQSLVVVWVNKATWRLTLGTLAWICADSEMPPPLWVCFPVIGLILIWWWWYWDARAWN